MSFVDLPYPKTRLVGKGALEYLESVINDATADIAINIDEDAFVTDPQALERLLEFVTSNGIAMAGMPDGGVVPIRRHNPLVVNPYFSIIDTAQIRDLLSHSTFAGFPLDGPDYLEAFPRELLRSEYSMDPFEPYEELLVWIARHSRVLYLDAREHKDGISTILLNHESQPFLTHTWYSRTYPKSPDHRRRIHAIINECADMNSAGRRITLPDAAVVRARVDMQAARLRTEQLLRRSELARRINRRIRRRQSTGTS